MVKTPSQIDDDADSAVGLSEGGILHYLSHSLEGHSQGRKQDTHGKQNED